ncbi:hypothetical protein CDAR_62911 [Caerostris darwini]|uniref:Ribosomal protein L2 n=1 Tax=Caerostris darwini TaxID=1538125 RepID=A0AAV4UFE7_9ARAC|nr:hypothetical protein CDAR_62911 [Caerostris darwini]
MVSLHHPSPRPIFFQVKGVSCETFSGHYRGIERLVLIHRGGKNPGKNRSRKEGKSGTYRRVLLHGDRGVRRRQRLPSWTRNGGKFGRGSLGPRGWRPFFRAGQVGGDEQDRCPPPSDGTGCPLLPERGDGRSIRKHSDTFALKIETIPKN